MPVAVSIDAAGVRGLERLAAHVGPPSFSSRGRVLAEELGPHVVPEADGRAAR